MGFEGPCPKRVTDKIRGNAKPHDLGSGDNQGGTFPELAVKYDVDPTITGNEDSEGQLSPVVVGAGSKPGIFVQNTPQI